MTVAESARVLPCGRSRVEAVYLFIDVFICLYIYIYLLKAYSLVNRTESPQGFSPNPVLQKLNTIQKMHIIQTIIIIIIIY